MCNYGPQTNGSQFFITFSPLPIFRGHNVVVGTVLKGMKVIRMIENLGTKIGKPVETVTIVGCGLYTGPECGPPYFSSPHLLKEFETGPISEEDFSRLPSEQQQRLISFTPQNT